MSALIVNLFGAPGAGKSTGAAVLFASLKNAGINAALVTEYAKDKTWEKNETALAAQDYIFAKQHYRIRCVVDQVDVVVTDCPLMLSSFYMRGDRKLGRPFRDLVRHVFSCYDNMNFFICRSKAYISAGRSQTEEQSNQIAIRLMDFLQRNHVSYSIMPGNTEGYMQIGRMIFKELAARGIVQNEEESAL